MHALGDRRQPRQVQTHAPQLELAQHAHQRQLDLLHQRLEPPLGDLLALPRRERPEQHGICGEGVLQVARQPPLFAQLGERIAAAGGLEQVGAEERVVAQPGRHEPERLRVVGHDGALAACRHHLLGSLAVADEHLLPGGDREAPRGALREQLALRRLHRRGDHHQLVPPQARDPPAGPAAHARPDHRLGRRGGRRRLRVAERLLEPAEGVAELVLAEDLPHARAVGLTLGLQSDVELDGEVALDGRQALAHAGVLGVVEEVLFALGPFDILDVPEHRLERPEALQQLARGLVPDPRHAGDVVGGVPLQAVEVGDQLGGDPVAVDHRLAVVDLRVGDPPRGRHHLHETVPVDQLEGVAVARHDHRRHRGLGGERPLGERGDHVVGLVALEADVAVAEGLDERFHRRPLLLEQVGPRAPRGLVLGEHIGATRGAGIPGDDRRADAVLGDDLHEHRGEAEDRVRGHARRGRDRLREREEGAVHEARAVDQEQPAVVPAGRLRGRAPSRAGVRCRVGRHPTSTLRGGARGRQADRSRCSTPATPLRIRCRQRPRGLFR